MAKKSRKEKDVEAYRHETETRKNVVPVGLASYDTETPKPKKYEYNPHLDPQLVWTRKSVRQRNLLLKTRGNFC